MAELGRLAAEKPALAEAANTLGDILAGPCLDANPSEIPAIAPDRIATKRASGIPLLRGESVPLDVAAFARRWSHICSVVEHSRKGPIAEALRRGTLDARDLTAAVIAGRPGAVHGRADELGLDAGLTATVLRLTLFPVFTQINDALIPMCSGDWEQGFCPTCGSWPL